MMVHVPRPVAQLERLTGDNEDDAPARPKLPMKPTELQKWMGAVLQRMVGDDDICSVIGDLTDRRHNRNTQRFHMLACSGIHLNTHLLPALDVREQVSPSAPEVQHTVRRPDVGREEEEVGRPAELASLLLPCEILAVVVQAGWAAHDPRSSRAAGAPTAASSSTSGMTASSVMSGSLSTFPMMLSRWNGGNPSPGDFSARSSILRR